MSELHLCTLDLASPREGKGAAHLREAFESKSPTVLVTQKECSDASGLLLPGKSRLPLGPASPREAAPAAYGRSKAAISIPGRVSRSCISALATAPPGNLKAHYRARPMRCLAIYICQKTPSLELT
eukprot:6806754-Pyramimonas_sp.AAC.1